LVRVHISEIDRGIPGTGQVNWAETLPELAGATRVWRDLFDDADQLTEKRLRFIKEQWLAAARRGIK
jgi:D-psicose/D-tagatose/L-ribulose 3-epimerase